MNEIKPMSQAERYIMHLKVIKRDLPDKYNNPGFVENSIKALDTAISALEAQQADRWIPVTERMPNEEEKKTCETFLCAWKPIYHSCEPHIHFYGLFIMYTDAFEWEIDKEILDTYKEIRVIAWKPLPTPYKEEQQ